MLNSLCSLGSWRFLSNVSILWRSPSRSQSIYVAELYFCNICCVKRNSKYQCFLVCRSYVHVNSTILGNCYLIKWGQWRWNFGERCIIRGSLVLYMYSRFSSRTRIIVSWRHCILIVHAYSKIMCTHFSWFWVAVRQSFSFSKDTKQQDVIKCKCDWVIILQWQFFSE